MFFAKQNNLVSEYGSFRNYEGKYISISLLKSLGNLYRFHTVEFIIELPIKYEQSTIDYDEV